MALVFSFDLLVDHELYKFEENGIKRRIKVLTGYMERFLQIGFDLSDVSMDLYQLDDRISFYRFFPSLHERLTVERCDPCQLFLKVVHLLLVILVKGLSPKVIVLEVERVP